jgi:HEAT repeat protein
VSLSPESSQALRHIKSADPALVVEAAKSLSEDKTTTDALVALLSHEERPHNRQAILYALAWHGALRTWDLMVRITGDSAEHPKVRGQAAEAVSYMFIEQQPGSSPFEAAVRVLSAATHDPSPEVRYCSVNALGCSGHLPLKPILEAMLDDHVAVPGWIGTVAEEAARSISWLADMSGQRQRRAEKKP